MRLGLILTYLTYSLGILTHVWMGEPDPALTAEQSRPDHPEQVEGADTVFLYYGYSGPLQDTFWGYNQDGDYMLVDKTGQGICKFPKGTRFDPVTSTVRYDDDQYTPSLNYHDKYSRYGLLSERQIVNNEGYVLFDLDETDADSIYYCSQAEDSGYILCADGETDIIAVNLNDPGTAFQIQPFSYLDYDGNAEQIIPMIMPYWMYVGNGYYLYAKPEPESPQVIYNLQTNEYRYAAPYVLDPEGNETGERVDLCMLTGSEDDIRWEEIWRSFDPSSNELTFIVGDSVWVYSMEKGNVTKAPISGIVGKYTDCEKATALNFSNPFMLKDEQKASFVSHVPGVTFLEITDSEGKRFCGVLGLNSFGFVPLFQVVEGSTLPVRVGRILRMSPSGDGCLMAYADAEGKMFLMAIGPKGILMPAIPIGNLESYYGSTDERILVGEENGIVGLYDWTGSKVTSVEVPEEYLETFKVICGKESFLVSNGHGKGILGLYSLEDGKELPMTASSFKADDGVEIITDCGSLNGDCEGYVCDSYILRREAPAMSVLLGEDGRLHPAISPYRTTDFSRNISAGFLRAEQQRNNDHPEDVKPVSNAVTGFRNIDWKTPLEKTLERLVTPDMTSEEYRTVETDMGTGLVLMNDRIGGYPATSMLHFSDNGLTAGEYAIPADEDQVQTVFSDLIERYRYVYGPETSTVTNASGECWAFWRDRYGSYICISSADREIFYVSSHNQLFTQSLSAALSKEGIDLRVQLGLPDEEGTEQSGPEDVTSLKEFFSWENILDTMDELAVREQSISSDAVTSREEGVSSDAVTSREDSAERDNIQKQKIVSYSFGSGSVAAVTESGTLYMWENRSFNIMEEREPRKVMEQVSYVSLGYDNSLITEDKSLFRWGSNQYGTLGDGTKKDREEPAWIMDDVVFVSDGMFTVGAITSDGDLYMWGNNDFGEIGDGTTSDSKVPVKVFSDCTAVCSGSLETFALTKDGCVYRWGVDRTGEEETETDAGSDQENSGCQLFLEDVVSLSSYGDIFAAITSDGSLYMWGDNRRGVIVDIETGYASFMPEAYFEPVKVLNNIVSVSLGSTCGAISKDGSLYMWGEKSYKDPERVRELENVTSFATNGTTFAAITEDGALYTMGSNLYGQLGDGTFEDRDTFEKVLDRIQSVQITSSDCGALTWDGELLLWGDSVEVPYEKVIAQDPSGEEDSDGNDN